MCHAAARPDHGTPRRPRDEKVTLHELEGKAQPVVLAMEPPRTGTPHS